MSEGPPIYRLLPELYRSRDAGSGFALKALTETLDEARATVARDIDGLYLNWFVETAEPWLLPYLGALVGGLEPPPTARDPRALVADAIALGRRKGTYPATGHMLAHLTGWPVRVIFDKETGKALVQVWPEPAYAVRQVSPYPAIAGGDWEGAGFHMFHPMGVDCPLFAVPRPYPGIEAPFVEHLDAPVALTRATDPEILSRAIEIQVEDENGALQAIPPEALMIGDLGEWCFDEIDPATSARAIVDPVLGRFMLIGPETHGRRVAVSVGYAAPGDIGGGPYEREMAGPAESTWLAYVHDGAKSGAGPGGEGRPPAFRTLAEALEAYRAVPDHGLIRILDSGGYDVDGLTIGNAALVCATDPNAPRRLTIEALSGEVPALRGALRVHGVGAGMELVLSGLWHDGHIALEGNVDAHLHHCSVHPITARRRARDPDYLPAALGVRGGDHSGLKLRLDACLTGPLRLAPGMALAVGDSVIDGYGGVAIAGQPAGTLARATILGSAGFSTLDAADSLFEGPVQVDDTDAARFRFGALPNGADFPGVSNCIMDEAAWAFRSIAFGMPGYARLAPEESPKVRTGASNGSEIGVFNAEHAYERERLLRDRLADSLPVGMDHHIVWR